MLPRLAILSSHCFALLSQSRPGVVKCRATGSLPTCGRGEQRTGPEGARREPHPPQSARTCAIGDLGAPEARSRLAPSPSPTGARSSLPYSRSVCGTLEEDSGAGGAPQLVSIPRATMPRKAASSPPAGIPAKIDLRHGPEHPPRQRRHRGRKAPGNGPRFVGILVGCNGTPENIGTARDRLSLAWSEVDT